MASSEVVTSIVAMVGQYFTYMLPIIGIMAGITFMVSFLYAVTINLGRKTFRG